MPEIAPFCGLRYNTDRFGTDLSKLVSPPYDVLDAEGKSALLARSDRNIVAVDLPVAPAASAGPDEAYTQAAERLGQWRTDGTLLLDETPAIYIYRQEYTHGGQHFLRTKFFARMRLEAFGEGSVFPHEQTFSGPKEDRLQLMRATRCQLSPVFALYSDPDRAVTRLLDVEDRPPEATAERAGVADRLWALRDESVIQTLCERLAGRAVYIADGHHRYGTALTYRESLGRVPLDHPARFVLVGLCAMEDPGCVILPTHRVLSGFGEVKAGEVLGALREGVEMTTADPSLTDPERAVPADAPHDIAVYSALGDRMYTGRFTRREILDTLAPGRSSAWRALDLAYVHAYLIDQLIAAGTLRGNAPTIQYTHSAADAVRLARLADGIALICKPCTVAVLRRVSEAGDLMPHKSTYFYPKLTTGLVIHPLE